jgi:hypothetical protein
MGLLEKKYNIKIIEITSDITQIKPPEDYDENEVNLLVFDDLVNSSIKDQKNILDLFIRGRKNNCCCCYISQSYFKTPKLIRDNVDYVIITKIKSTSDLTRILKEKSLDIEPDHLKEIYKNIRMMKGLHFLLLDSKTNKPEFQARLDFGAIK